MVYDPFAGSSPALRALKLRLGRLIEHSPRGFLLGIRGTSEEPECITAAVTRVSCSAYRGLRINEKTILFPIGALSDYRALTLLVGSP